MVRFVCVVALATLACKSSVDPDEERRKQEDARDHLLASLEHYCDDGAVTPVPGLGSYRRGQGGHGVVAIERDQTAWNAIGGARPAGAAAPRDPTQIEAVACIDKTWVHEIEKCSLYDDRGLAAKVFQRGRGFAKIRFLDASTGALIVETKVDSDTAPPPCPDGLLQGHDTSGWVTPVKDASIDAVLERFRTGSLVPAPT